MGENTRLLYDKIQFTEEYNIPGVIVLIDFEKAFYLISFKLIEKNLRLL